MKILKFLILFVFLLLINCVRIKKEEPIIAANVDSEIVLSDPLLLDGKQFVNQENKYRKNETELIVSINCDFRPNADIRWYSFEGIEQLTNLKYLSVDGENLDMVDFSPLSSLSNLERLYIHGNITRLPDLTGLKYLISIGIKDAKLESLEGIGAPNVRRIDVSNSKEFSSLSPFNNLLYLEKLVINGGGSRVYKISDMSNLPNLKDLRLLLYSTKLDLSGIEKISALEKLHVEWPEPINIEGIGKLEKLQQLYLNLVSPQPSLEFLKNMPNLIDLSLSTVRKIEPDHILDVSPLATLKSLRRLSCTDFIIKNINTLDVLDALSVQDDESPGYIYLAGCKLYDEKDKSKHPLILEHPVRE